MTFPHVSAASSGTATTSTYLEKMSVRTKTDLFFLAVIGKGPVKSSASLCLSNGTPFLICPSGAFGFLYGFYSASQISQRVDI
ncbi:hypothetical protein DPMN_053136 [Dreissena polymorpha]|uniref:Uncharacterized protein n=1 Tax=Dreissena polymorpha TaxID=45954 RepID=A0A9D4CMG1_DREPO|nr:hypothetical protein DPMN_053136 [Dreissena polymorpha]